MDLGPHFRAKLAHLGAKLAIKALQEGRRSYKIFASFFFSMDSGPHFPAKLAHLGAKLAIKAPLEALLGALGRHLGSKTLPRRTPEDPGPPQTSIFLDLGTIFGRIFCVWREDIGNMYDIWLGRPHVEIHPVNY